VFLRYLEVLDLIEYACLDPHDFIYGRIDGKRPHEDRTRIIREFQEGKKPYHGLLISLGYGEEGITLTAACRMVLMEPQWNPSSDMQAIARIHRIGQLSPTVACYRLFCTGTVDEHRFLLQTQKIGLSKVCMEEEEQKRHLSDEDLQQLFTYDRPHGATEKAYG